MSDTLADEACERAARDFLAQWSVSFDAMCASFGQYLSADCRWDQRPLPVSRGPIEAVRFLQRGQKLLGLATIDVEITQLAVRDGVVHSARIDHLRRADGSLMASAPVAGVMVFRDGKIADWREYFDIASVAGSFCSQGLIALCGKLQALRRGR